MPHSLPPAKAAATGLPLPRVHAADRQKAPDEWQKKLDKQKEKIDALNHELDLDQREYKLRAAAIYGDAGARLRNATEWDKEDTQYKSSIDGKQKALDAARQELRRTAGTGAEGRVVEKEKDSDNSSNTDKK
jgi:hypothetical protein